MTTNKVSIIALLGVPGSGKSSAIHSLSQPIRPASWKPHREVVVVCPDTIREELCDGDRGDMTRNQEVFGLASERALDALLNGHHVIWDATNATPLARATILGVAKTVRGMRPDWSIEARLVVIQTPHKVSWQRNAEREQWRVPDEVMLTMIGQFERSLTQVGAESWDVIEFQR